jgi:hypothetical protein
MTPWLGLAFLISAIGRPCRQRAQETPRRRCVGATGAQLDQRKAGGPFGDFVALGRQDALQDIAHQVPFDCIAGGPA